MSDMHWHFCWSFTDYKVIRGNIPKKPMDHTEDLISFLNLEKFPGEKQ